MKGLALDYNPQTDTTEVLVNEENIVEVRGSYPYGEEVKVSEFNVVGSHFNRDDRETVPWYDRDY